MNDTTNDTTRNAPYQGATSTTFAALAIALVTAMLGNGGCDGCSAAAATGLTPDVFDEPHEDQANRYPFVLVHGFFGWGRDEVLGWKHFGGVDDIEADLRQAGYPTVTVALGPLSSNWDRACEMYAQLRGGTVDYGAAHAAAHGHARFGRTYEALLPGVGEAGASGPRRVNLIAHSQGAQTARLFTTLLADGSAAERQACPNGACSDGLGRISPLFTGQGDQWVHSVASLAGAHDGSTLAHAIQNDLNLNDLIAGLAAMLNAFGADAIYDFKLDHFGVAARQSGESVSAYAERVMNTMLDSNSLDTAFYDLSLDGAAALNAQTPAQPDVHYFAWSNHTTTAGSGGKHVPTVHTNLVLSLFAFFIGSYVDENPAPRPSATAALWENDGITNTAGMDGPTLGRADPQVALSGTPRAGRWQHVRHLDNWDHWDVLGLLDQSRGHGVHRELYLEAAQLLRDTPER